MEIATNTIFDPKKVRIPMNSNKWNTWKTVGYSYDVAQDQASAGGVHHHQIKLGKAGWMSRICQSNGNHESHGPVVPIPAALGEAHFEQAQSQA